MVRRGKDEKLAVALKSRSKEAVKWLRKAAEAIEWYDKAAEQGDQQAKDALKRLSQ